MTNNNINPSSFSTQNTEKISGTQNPTGAQNPPTTINTHIPRSTQKIAVIGVGTMGSKYAALIQDGKIEGLELTALTRVKDPYKGTLRKSINAGVPIYQSAEELFEALENKKLSEKTVNKEE